VSISTLCWCICLVLTAWINQKKKKELEKTKVFTRSKGCVTVNARSLKMVSTKESKEEFTGTNYQSSLFYDHSSISYHCLFPSFPFRVEIHYIPLLLTIKSKEQSAAAKTLQTKSKDFVPQFQHFPCLSTLSLLVLDFFLLEVIASRSPFNLPLWLLYLVNAACSCTFCSDLLFLD